ncbi:MAG TPA: hypothetical protein VFM18_21710 [Methanosarcina sp.]|nr:hypothetical protein [Methanosarcina sp.]
MSDNQNIFSNGNTPPGNPQGIQQQVPNDQNNQPFADLLGSIKNERGEPKYKDVQTALEALKHSQQYIPELKSEAQKNEEQLTALQAEVERLRSVEQTVLQLTQQQQQLQQQPAPVPVIDETVVANLVNQQLTQRQIQDQHQSNLKSVVDTMQKALGAEAEKTFYAKAQELGMTAEQINSLAATSPVAVLQLFGLQGQPQIKSNVPTAPTSSINTGGLTPPQQTYISRNIQLNQVGATTSELQAERDNSKKLVEELHSKGMTTYDLTDPKTFFKYFGK